MSSSTQEEECMELKNIKYKTMLISGSDIQETKTSADMRNLERFLEEEKFTNQAETWCKLYKTIKTQKLIVYAETYAVRHKLPDSELAILVLFLKECLNKKKLGRVKDVTYDKDAGIIKDIPSLMFNKSSRQYTLKRTDRRVSTLKSLPQKSNKKLIIKTTKKTTSVDSVQDTDD